jgi:hypothetical protein
MTQKNGDVVAQLTPVWEYPVEEKTAVGQPILANPKPQGEGLSGKKLYFLQNGGGAEPKLVAVKALDGNKVSETTTPAKMAESTDGVPVVDSAGDVILWANNFTALLRTRVPCLLPSRTSPLFRNYSLAPVGPSTLHRRPPSAPWFPHSL